MQNVKLRFERLPEETILMLDQLRMKQVIINLISNALKFSRDNSLVVVKLSIYKAKDPSDEVDLKIEVVD